MKAPGVSPRCSRALATAPSIWSLLGRQDDLGAEGLEQLAALEAHALGHRQDAAIPAHRAHERQADARVAAGRLDHDAAGLQRARALGVFDHRQADAVFDRAAGVGLLHLRPDRRPRPSRAGRADRHQGRVTHEVEHAIDEPAERSRGSHS